MHAHAHAHLDHDVEDQDAPIVKGKLVTAEDVARFLVAGNATVTLLSLTSGQRFTYQCSQVHDRVTDKPVDGKFFVGLLSGPDNEADYAYIGLLARNGEGQPWQFRRTQKSKVTETSPGFVAFNYVTKQILNLRHLAPNLEVWHEGRCGRCGRRLTVPESIKNGLGPICATKVAH